MKKAKKKFVPFDLNSKCGFKRRVDYEIENEMQLLASYGYNMHEIARQLNITEDFKNPRGGWWHGAQVSWYLKFLSLRHRPENQDNPGFKLPGDEALAEAVNWATGGQYRG